MIYDTASYIIVYITIIYEANLSVFLLEKRGDAQKISRYLP
ncbi:hypothetical protein FHS10_003624 [Mucilaginibacter dorajii]|nr:hypothetical protein [Mucilaginibacter dorajii]